MPAFDKWHGLITGTITPFTPAGNIDWVSFERHIDHLCDTGIAGLLANAMMAEGLHLTQAERDSVLRYMVELSDGKVPIIATIYGVNTEDAAEQGYQAARAGAQALLVFPHPAFGGVPLDPAIPAAYFRAIWERAALPMIVFRLPGATAPSLDLEALKRLADTPGVAAVKDTVADPAFYTGEGAFLLAPDSPLKILVDSDAVMLDFLRRGAHGATSICATAFPDGYLRLFNDRSSARADHIDAALRGFSDVVFKAPRRDFRARLKAALAADGIIACDRVRAPLPDISGAERRAIADALRTARLKISD